MGLKKTERSEHKLERKQVLYSKLHNDSYYWIGSNGSLRLLSWDTIDFNLSAKSPFFLNQHDSLVRGRGDLISNIVFPKYFFLMNLEWMKVFWRSLEPRVAAGILSLDKP